MPQLMQSTAKIPVYIELETTNASFLEMSHYLKAKGIKNHNFMLILYDKDLAGIDIYDQNLSMMMKTKILREMIINPWFFFRNIRLPVQGSGGAGVRFKLHRGNMAMLYMMMLNFNTYTVLPRQKGKTTGVALWYLYCFNFHTSNSEFMLLNLNHDRSKANLSEIKKYREALPVFLRMDSPVSDFTGKKLKVPNSAEVLQHPSNRNRIKTLPSAKNKQLANTLGRGCTQPLQWYDEFAWIVHNQLIYESATPAFDTASQNAKRNGAPYGITLTTTPGDMTTVEGIYAYKVRNDSVKFDEQFYDFTADELHAAVDSNDASIFVYIEFSYQQLGETEEYFKRQVRQLQKNWPTIRREVLLEWSNVSDNNPFGKEDLDIIQQYCRPPIRTLLLGPYRQYQMLIYKDMDLSHGQIIGVDVSAALRRDSSAITIIDAKTTETVATLNCNYLDAPDLVNVIYELVTKYLPNALVVVEKNGVGQGVIPMLVKSSIKKNLYYTIEDRVMQERTNGVTTIQQKVRIKSYGFNTTKENRQRMHEILFQRVQYHKDKFIAMILHDEMAGLTYKTTGGYTRIDHSETTHDDQLMSYLLALKVWYDDPELANRFNIHRGELLTDQDIEEQYGAIENLYGEGYELIDIQREDINEEDPIIGESASVLKDMMKPHKTVVDMMNEEYLKDQEALMDVVRSPQGVAAIQKAYNIDLSNPNLYNGYSEGIYNNSALSSEFFDSWYNDTDNEGNLVINNGPDRGNMYDIFSKL
jgi:hypothetical protein